MDTYPGSHLWEMVKITALNLDKRKTLSKTKIKSKQNKEQDEAVAILAVVAIKRKEHRCNQIRWSSRRYKKQFQII